MVWAMVISCVFIKFVRILVTIKLSAIGGVMAFFVRCNSLGTNWGQKMLAWESSYKINHRDMDAQHLVLFSLLNQLDININADLSGECVDDILSALIAYMDYHFAHEEDLMRRVGYPHLETHITTHRAFTEHVGEMRDRLAGVDPLQAALKVRNVVLEWLLGHILETDIHYARFIENGEAA